VAENKADIFKKGDFLFVQGREPNHLFMLKSGLLEILKAPDEYNDLASDIIISKSKRVGLVKPGTLISGLSKFLAEPYSHSLRAVQDSQVVSYPLRKGGIKAIALADPPRTSAVLKQLYNMVSSSMNTYARALRLYQNISIIRDNLYILLNELSGGNATDEQLTESERLSEMYSANGGLVPEKIDIQFLVSDHSRFISGNYEFPGEKADVLFKNELSSFIKQFLKLENGLLNSIIKSDPQIGINMFNSLSDIFSSVLGRTEILIQLINDELNILFGEGPGWTSLLVDDGGFDSWINSGRLDDNFVKNYLSLIVKINSVYEETTGIKLIEEFTGVKKIHQYYTGNKHRFDDASKQTDVQKEARSKPDGTGGSSGEGLKHSMGQIFEFSLVDKDFQNKFLKSLNDFKNSKNPFNTESEGRKLRRHLSKMYWDLYKQTFIRSKTESSVPRAVKLMLKFGFLDDEMVEDGQIAELNDLARQREKAGDISVMFESEFLSKIYDGKETPSITEMGLTYDAYLREQDKHSRKKRNEEASVIGDENILKTMYEIEQRLASTAAVCSGSTATAFPILTSHAMKGSLKNAYSSRFKVETIVNELKDIDFSAFYRETVLKIDEAREIIKEEVLPYFILLPVYGTKTLLWQELSGTNKRTRGRIVIPVFFMGDLKKSLAHTFACYRWELNRTTKGALWADPVDGGITGEYFDYVNTFKKNSKLSAEAKEKIKEKFKSLRTNRDRFADDYLNWVLYEKNGIMKLNSVVRAMFFKHVPFQKESRDRLENMPAFSQSATRYSNINKKAVEAYHRRFKKYQDEEGNYPPEIQNYFKFLGL